MQVKISAIYSTLRGSFPLRILRLGLILIQKEQNPRPLKAGKYQDIIHIILETSKE